MTEMKLNIPVVKNKLIIIYEDVIFFLSRIRREQKTQSVNQNTS
jgi:hypothetical protein